MEAPEKQLSHLDELYNNVLLHRKEKDNAIKSLEEAIKTKDLYIIGAKIDIVGIKSKLEQEATYEYCKLTKDLCEFAYNHREEIWARNLFKKTYSHFFFALKSQNKNINPYQILNIPKEATKMEIVKAYRKITKECRPDLETSSRENIDKFILATEAYEMLCSD